MDTHDHDHLHATAPGPRQVQPESIIRTQTAELNRINDNRIFLLSLIDDLQTDLNGAYVEIASLRERLEQYEANEAADAAEVKAPARASSNGDAPAET